ncbi:MAG: PQQ-binding-like beta-propeller repeat protein [Myxococcaceae bacterium]
MSRSLSIAAVCVALCGCHSVPLSDDPTHPRQMLEWMADERQSPTAVPALYDVDWWKSLVVAPFFEYGPLEPAAPALDPETERVIVETRDGHVRCLSPIDGKVEWDVTTPNRFWAGATVSDGVAYVPGGDGVLYAFKARTGDKLWTYNAGEELVTQPVLDNGTVYVASQSDTLFAVEAATGKWIWQYRRDLPVGFSVRGSARPSVHGGMVYQGFADGSVVALAAKDGATKWERKLTTTGGNQFLDVDTSPVVDGAGHVFAASYKDGISCLDAKSGDLVWTSARPGITSMIPAGGVLYTTGDGRLGAVSVRDGRQLWSIDLSDKKKIDNSGGAPLLARGSLVVPTSTGLLFVDPASGHPRLGWNPGKGVTATPVQDGKRLYVLSNLGTLFALHLYGSGH